MFDDSLHDGDAVLAYVFRPAGITKYKIGHVTCGEAQHKPPEEYTLGVRELLADGRLGWYSDGATQSSWPVLLAPDVRVMSPPATKTLYKPSPDQRTKTQNTTDHTKTDPDNTANQPRTIAAGEARRRTTTTRPEPIARAATGVIGPDEPEHPRTEDGPPRRRH